MSSDGGPVRVGLVGLGRMGWRMHAGTIAKLPEQYRLVAACDLLTQRREEAAEAFDCQTYAQYDQLIADADVELVVVAVPSHLHAGVAIAAMEGGKDVLVEKPFATSLAQADQMIAAAKRTGRTLTSSQNRRYDSDFLKIKEVIESGKLGRILEIKNVSHGFQRRWDWQTLQEFGGGTLNNIGTHFVDQVLLLLGDVEPEVVCQVVKTPFSFGDAEDHVKIILRVPGGPLADIEMTSVCAYPEAHWLIMGTQGTLVGTGLQCRWKYVQAELAPAHQVSREPTEDRSYNREDLPVVEETWEAPNEPGGSILYRLYLRLYQTLRRGAQNDISLESVRRQIAVLDRCHQSGVEVVG